MKLLIIFITFLVIYTNGNAINIPTGLQAVLESLGTDVEYTSTNITPNASTIYCYAFDTKVLDHVFNAEFSRTNKPGKETGCFRFNYTMIGGNITYQWGFVIDNSRIGPGICSLEGQTSNGTLITSCLFCTTDNCNPNTVKLETTTASVPSSTTTVISSSTSTVASSSTTAVASSTASSGSTTTTSAPNPENKLKCYDYDSRLPNNNITEINCKSNEVCARVHFDITPTKGNKISNLYFGSCVDEFIITGDKNVSFCDDYEERLKSSFSYKIHQCKTCKTDLCNPKNGAFNVEFSLLFLSATLLVQMYFSK